ncbi:MAG: ribokinase [Hormoscilla sp.]
MTIVVFGSINIDLVAKLPRFPHPGETVSGTEFFTAAGGKGANQAVASARLGISTHLVGRVGADDFGQQLLHSLRENQVLCDRISIDNSTHSGVAVISVDAKGENQIVVIPGANGRINTDDVERLQDILPQATALLLQLEIPMPAVISAARSAQQAGVPVILDPAPVPAYLPPELYPLIDIITPNEVEASQLTGLPVNSPQTAAAAAEVLLERGAKQAIVTLGGKGVFCATGKENFAIPAFAVPVVDTVGAGDAFNGGLAAALSADLSLRQAAIWGAAAAAMAVSAAGGMPAMPDRLAFEAFLQQQGVV